MGQKSRDRENKTKWAIAQIEDAGRKGDEYKLDNIVNWALRHDTDFFCIEDVADAARKQIRETDMTGDSPGANTDVMERGRTY